MTTSLSDGTVNKSYSTTITATGTTPLTWDISGLPDGLTSDKDNATGDTLTITGTPIKAGSFESVKVSVTNNAGNDSKTYTIKINSSGSADPQDPDNPTKPAITTKELPSGTINKPYSAKITATGSTPLTWYISGLPSGLDYADSIGTNTLITGTPNISGTFEITITATNNAGSDSKTLTLNVNNALTSGAEITTPSLPAGFQGQQYITELEATGSGESTWTASYLPDGLTV